MGTYYRWRKSSVKYEADFRYTAQCFTDDSEKRLPYTLSYSSNYELHGNKIELTEPITKVNLTSVGPRYAIPPNRYFIFDVPFVNDNIMFKTDSENRYATVFIVGDYSPRHYAAHVLTTNIRDDYTTAVLPTANIVAKPDVEIGFVYSTSSSTYPNGGESGGYYYDQRTTVTSPTNPSSITFGTPKAGESLTITAGASTDVVGSGSLTYIFWRQIDNESWTQVAATYNKTITDGVPGSGEYINYQVKARDKNGIESYYTTGTKKPIEYPILITDPGIPQYKYPVSGKEMLVTWDPSAVPEKAPLTYIVEKQIDSEPWSEVARVSENSYTFTVPEVTAEGKRLTIRVKATDNGGNESKYSTGKATEILYHKVIRLIPWNFGTDFRIRQFTKNSRSQYQTMLAGSTAEIVATGNLRLGDMPVGTLVRVSGNTIEDINWKIADQNHPGYPENSTTLITDKIIRLMCLDAKEPSNTNPERRRAGNNRYIYSNIHQWLNSDKPAGQWYSAQHSQDAPPSRENVENNQNSYDTWSGFLTMLNPKFVSKLIQTTLKVIKVAADGGNFETFNAKVFLASTNEVGHSNENGIVEGSLISIFSNDASRVAYPSEECIDKSEYKNPAINASTSYYWILRTPLTSSENYVRGNTGSGGLSSGPSNNNSSGIRPLCNISADTMLDPNPNPDGSYNIVWE